MNDSMNFKRRSDAERRRRQAEKYARVLAVRDYLGDDDRFTTDKLELIASLLKCSTRTIRRDVETIRICREINKEN